MKKLFTFVFALVTAIAASAQADFTVGENVAAKLGLGDVDGMSFSGTVGPNDDTNRPHDKVVQTLGDYWKVDGDLPNEFLESFDGHIGIYGFYDKKEADMYQVVKFPAGAYTIDVQALYREGTPADNFTNHFNKKYMKYGHLYADVLTSEDPASEVTRNFDKVLCSLATPNQHEQVYYYGDGSWMNDYKYDLKDKETGEVTSYYCPQCLVGLSEYFALGKYHNTMKIVVTEDSYIRLGFRKTGSITADWLVFSNLQVIYDGPADEAQKLELAKEEALASLSNLEDIYNDVEAAGFSALAGSISDMLMESGDAIYDGTSVEEVVAVNKSLIAAVQDYEDCLQFVKNLSSLLSQCEAMLASTEFEGYATFKADFDKYNALATTDNPEDLGDNATAYYKGIYDELSKSRADYLNSQPANEKGAKDFTSLITNPWFVQPQYNPTQNEDGTWTLKEGGWADWGSVSGSLGCPKAYAEMNLASKDLVDICEGVTLYPSNDVTNEWYRVNAYSGWSAGLQLMYQGGVVGVSDGWNSVSSGTIGIEQALVGLPNGYYSLKGLVRGNFWAGEQTREIYAENSKGEVVVSETVKNDSDTPNGAAYGWYEWNPNVWSDVETSIISALDGKLKIGGRCTGVANFTGFRLFFYGENLNFDEKLGEYIDKLQSTIDALTFAGDKKKVNDILAQIADMRPIQDSDGYNAAYELYTQAKEIVSLASNGESKYKAFDKMMDIASHEFVEPALTYMTNFGDAETDTYEQVDELNGIADAYTSYCEVYDKAATLDNAMVAEIIKKQTAEMTAAMKTAEEINAYLEELAVPYSYALMDAMGCATATADAPTDITSLIINPDFTNNPTNGWSGETPTNNEYAFDEKGQKANAELWNKSAFTLSQVLTGLPAGTYELRVKAIYRDGQSVTQELVDAYNAAGNEEAWANHNARLFASTSDKNKQTSYIKAIESLNYTENSFTEVVTDWGSEEMSDGTINMFVNKAVAIEGTAKSYAAELYGDDVADGAYPFDTKVGDNYYPASMQGFYQVCQKHPADVANSVQITIETGDNLTIGIDKTAAIASDWVIFDDFELLYLTGEDFKKAGEDIKNGTWKKDPQPQPTMPIEDLLAADYVYIYDIAAKEVLVGNDAQNVGMVSYDDAKGTSKAAPKFKLEEREIDGKTYYQFRALTPAGENYGLWGSNPTFLNSQPNVGGVSFVLGKDQDGTNGSAWELIYDEATNTWALKSALSGGYLSGNQIVSDMVYYTIAASLPAPIEDLLAAESLYIFDQATETVLVGNDAQNVAMVSYEEAQGTSKAAPKFKLEEREIEGKTYYQFKALTPAGADYGLWGSNPTFLNSQPNVGGVSFVLGKDQDGTNGSAWELIYDETTNTWAFKSALSNGYLSGNQIVDAPVYYSIAATLPDPSGIASVTSNTISNGAVYNVAGQRVSDNYKGIIIKNGKKYLNK
ncbi:MAG: hypothetical protein KBT33_11850 [Prevotellaceae bacterium]|nr:hypothetical protein [Candidatus Minthosoma equi]